MKILLLCLFTLGAFICSAQIYKDGDIEGKDSCDFSSSCSIIRMDSSVDNIWHIGTPNKEHFRAGINDSMSLFTDTSIYYKENILSSFEISAPNYPGSNYSYFDVNALLSFWHKLSSDTLKDGGYIEISTDSGTTWQNVVYDSVNIESMQVSGFGYNMYGRDQKLSNNQPGFSGTISEWTLCEIPFIRSIPVFAKTKTLIRFTFVSDSISSQKEGWMIDNIKLSHVQLHGGLNQLNTSFNPISVYPNPCSNQMTVTSVQGNFNGILSILNIEGKVLQKITLKETKSADIDISDLQEGIYTLVYHDYTKGDSYFKLVK